jgi:hypothetical protein
MSFRPVSIEITQTITKKDKQDNGIFFTPKEDRDILLGVLDSLGLYPTSILEPSFGSGEFLEDLYERYPNAAITGVEKNAELFGSTVRPNVYNMDFLEYSGKHDMIVGNPPYFVIPKSSDTLKCQKGRPNMFVQFLYKSVTENLTSDGHLGFILPTSFYNATYYEPMRRHIFENTTVIAVSPLSGKYIDTQQSTFCLVLQNGKRNDDFMVEINGSVYLTPDKSRIVELMQGSSTLKSIGFKVSTGDVVWNQVKESLVDSGGTLLIYSGNIRNGVLCLNEQMKEEKKQYIQGFAKEPISGVSILLNRGYGNAAYILNPVIVNFEKYHAENHVNVIRPETPEAKKFIGRVYDSLCNEKTAEFISLFVGNNALSKTEIESCLPIWLA